MRQISVDVSELLSKQASIVIVDNSSGGWGHVNADNFTSSDKPVVEPIKPSIYTDEENNPTPFESEKELILDKRFIIMPYGGPGGFGKEKDLSYEPYKAELIVGDKTVRTFFIDLAQKHEEPTFWVYLDVTPFKGKKATFRVLQNCDISRITVSETIPGEENIYQEKLRPRFHFTTRRGWLNDANGLVYHNGLWHLFHQHNPYGYIWYNSHWGHAVSKDLFHWVEWGDAIYPWVDAKQFPFSGSAAVDFNNTAGFKTGDNDVLVAVFSDTGHGDPRLLTNSAGESVAYSNDNGLTWEMYEGNPVVTHNGRDAKIFWHEPTKRWVMAVFTSDDPTDYFNTMNHIAIYNSPDLKKWELQSKFGGRGLIGGMFECPELFELPVDGNKNNTRWVIYDGSGAYTVGRFDGKVFTPDDPIENETIKKKRVRHGMFRAAQNYNNAPDNRVVQIGWLCPGNEVFAGMPFNQQMTVPVDLTLRTTKDDGICLFAEPVKELEDIRGRNYRSGRDMLLSELPPQKEDLPDMSYEIDIAFEMNGAKKLILDFAKPDSVEKVQIVYDDKLKSLTLDGIGLPAPSMEGNTISIRVLIDVVSMEAYLNHGRVAMSWVTNPLPSTKKPRISAEGGNPKIVKFDLWELKKCWPDKAPPLPVNKRKN
jgi:fructan beta-fructosidase